MSKKNKSDDEVGEVYEEEKESIDTDASDQQQPYQSKKLKKDLPANENENPTMIPLCLNKLRAEVLSGLFMKIIMAST